MNIRTIEKAPRGTTAKAFESKLNLTFNDKFKRFDVSDSNEKLENSQCLKCHPPLSKPLGAVKLCASCKAEGEQKANALLDNFKKHRTVHKLDRYCFACNSPKTSAAMSKILPICRTCATELKTKGATAKNNFVEKIKANVGRRLKAATI